MLGMFFTLIIRLVNQYNKRSTLLKLLERHMSNKNSQNDISYSSSLSAETGCGLTKCPKNKMMSVRLSMMKKRKGWLALKGVGMVKLRATAITAVAAAASDPSSFTSTIALKHKLTFQQEYELNIHYVKSFNPNQKSRGSV